MKLLLLSLTLFVVVTPSSSKALNQSELLDSLMKQEKQWSGLLLHTEEQDRQKIELMRKRCIELSRLLREHFPQHSVVRSKLREYTDFHVDESMVRGSQLSRKSAFVWKQISQELLKIEQSFAFQVDTRAEEAIGRIEHFSEQLQNSEFESNQAQFFKNDLIQQIQLALDEIRAIENVQIDDVRRSIKSQLQNSLKCIEKILEDSRENYIDTIGLVRLQFLASNLLWIVE